MPEGAAKSTSHRPYASLPAAQAPLTIATGLNPGRLDQLESQCQSWGGPLSAAVYLVLPQYEGFEGAAAAGEPARVYEAAILKVIGAERRRILTSFALRSVLMRISGMAGS